MVVLHTKILEKDGKKEFVVIPYEEFIQIQEELEDYEGLKALRDAKIKEANAPTTSFNETKKELDIE
ncbi:type II toxin-antitoxin system Phd/YefM family antitoxin [bacterium]|nr:type II toxin-antitoxin system Phd/YefM family antitoxin [bacterium]MBU1152622.1 type II toxin-antitoxin system Phd/YefM family antitoxin [bacterium]MBU1781988.1 type II toxin-antitoxin system Phd/YefM family antitoxin [bacterium]MBU2600454.1 type II toxin-antitoxin system Phd/YefM family antitoxin [bacterium]